MTRRRRTGRRPAESQESMRWSSVNWILLGLGILVLALGYILLARGSVVGAPLLLVLGYAVVIPLGIIR